jgi:hypothetical protein
MYSGGLDTIEWEYLVVHLSEYEKGKDELNEYGKEGWELVSVAVILEKYVWGYLKRQKT